MVETSANFLSLVDNITPIQQPTIIEESVYSLLEDHGGKQKQSTSDQDNITSIQQQNMIEESFYSSLKDHGGKQKQSTSDPKPSTHPKHSPRHRKPQNHKRQREQYPKLNIFSSEVRKPPKKKQSGKHKLYNRIVGRNVRNMHLRLPKKERTAAQEKESGRAKIVDRELQKHPASPGDIGQIIAAAVGIPASQVSEYDSGEIQDDEGIEFCSQEG